MIAVSMAWLFLQSLCAHWIASARARPITVFRHLNHNSVASVCKRERGRSRRKCIHENELNGETVLGHVPKLMALWLTKFLNEANKQRKSCYERQARKQRGRLWLRNSMRVLLHRRRVINSVIKIITWVARILVVTKQWISSMYF